MSDSNNSQVDDQEVVNFVESSMQDIARLEQENEELKSANQKLAEEKAALESDNVRLEKVAAESCDSKKRKKKKPEYSKEAVNKTLDKLADLSYINANDKNDLAEVLVSDPDKIFDLVCKVAEVSVMSPDGAGIDKIPSNVIHDTDPHGWGEAVRA
jgi:regulator of replication initiation timing